nr:MAG TPA: Photosynthesis system II assembly factor YCF48 [Caudoviricetes sp.]
MSIFYTNKTITMNRGDSGVVLLSILNRDDTPFALPIGMKNPTIVFSVKAETDANDLNGNMLIEEYMPIKDYTYYGYGTPDAEGQMKIHGGFYPKSKTVNTPESVVDTGIIYKVLYDESTGAHNKYMFVVPTTTPPVYPIGLTKREYAFAVPLVFEPAFTDRLSPGTYTYSITLLDSTSPVQLTQGEGDNATTVDNYNEFLSNVTLKQDLFGSQKLVLSDSPIARVHGDPIRRIYNIKPCSEESVTNATASEITTGNITNIALPPVYIATKDQLGGVIVGETLQVDFRGVLNVSEEITNKIADLYNKIGDMKTLTTDEKTTLVGAINEVDEHADANKINIGNLSALTTDEKNTLVGAINEVDAHANTGISKADAAQATADNATVLANTGISKADAAQATADNAQQDAETAQATADNATILANDGISKADRAQSTANTAVDNANDAKATAQEAIMKADGRATSIGFMTAKDAVTALNGYPRTQLKGGDTIWIVEDGTPDLWVTDVAQESVPYNYTTKDKFNQDLVDNKVLQIGYFKTAYQESDGKPVTIAWQNVVVKNWIASTEFADFPYEAKIELTDFVDYTTVPQVVFDIADTMSGNYAPICKSGDKCVYIYSKVQNEITLKTVITFAPNVNGASVVGGGYNNRGKWVASTTYEIDDLVYTDNGQYVCIEGITSTTSPEQDTQHWQATFVANVPVKSVNGQTGAVTIDVPTKTSDLTNDSNFATISDIPTKTSDLTNDSNFATTSDIPTKTSQLTNDSGFITANDIPTVSEASPQEASALKSGNLPTSGWITPEQGWKQNTLPASRKWTRVTYGDGKYVAVAFDSDKGAYSTDGITWTEMSMPANRRWQGVAYGDGKFVAVASNSDKGAYSTDGITWTEMTLPASRRWECLTYGDGKFVTVAVNSMYGAYSTDGITWTEMTLPAKKDWSSVTYGDGKFVAVSNSVSLMGAYSIDGITWTETTLTSKLNWRSVTYGNGKFVALAANTQTSSTSLCAYSTDGINWTGTTLPSSGSWVSITYGDGKFVAIIFNTDKGAYSADGISWTEFTLPASSPWYEVTYGNGKFVAVAANTANGVYQNTSSKSTYAISDTSITANSDILMELTDEGGVKARALANGSITVIRDTVPTQPIPYTYKVKQTNASGQFTLVNHFVPEIPEVPTKTSELTNDSNFATTSDIPTKTSQLTNDSGFITQAESKTITNASTNVSITGSAKPYLFTVTDSDITSDKFVLLYPLDETTETWLNENSLSSIITEASGKFTFKVAVNTLPSTYSMKYFIQ